MSEFHYIKNAGNKSPNLTWGGPKHKITSTNLHPDVKQQFTSDAKPRCVEQLLIASQIRLVWHSLLESQSPSSSPQGFTVVQKSSSPTDAS